MARIGEVSATAGTCIPSIINRGDPALGKMERAELPERALQKLLHQRPSPINGDATKFEASARSAGAVGAEAEARRGDVDGPSDAGGGRGAADGDAREVAGAWWTTLGYHAERELDGNTEPDDMAAGAAAGVRHVGAAPVGGDRRCTDTCAGASRSAGSGQTSSRVATPAVISLSQELEMVTIQDGRGDSGEEATRPQQRRQCAATRTLCHPDRLALGGS